MEEEEFWPSATAGAGLGSAPDQRGRKNAQKRGSGEKTGERVDAYGAAVRLRIFVL